jgi:gas vesicle protein
LNILYRFSNTICAKLIVCKGDKNMRTTQIIKGLAVGMLVGAAVYLMTSDCMKTTRKSMKKSATRALKQARNVLDQVSYMIK